MVIQKQYLIIVLLCLKMKKSFDALIEAISIYLISSFIIYKIFNNFTKLIFIKLKIF